MSYWIKAGSVGGPYRDGVPAANSVLYDTESQTITLFRIHYDTTRLREALLAHKFFRNLPTIRKYAAYQYYFKGPIAMGVEVPPEAWGGHVYTIAEIDALADAVNAKGAAGLMLWSMQKQTAAQQFATEMCTKLKLSNCAAPMF